MGSLHNGTGVAAAGSYKRGAAPVPRASAGGGGARRPGVRSRFARFLLFEKVDYLQWIGTAAAFFFVTIVFVAFLPGSVVVERPTMLLPFRRAGGVLGGREASLPRDLGSLETGEGLAFEPTKLRERWARDRREEAESLAELGRPVRRVGVRKALNMPA